MNLRNKVSIIIPLYNSEKYIKECVESCRKQSYKNIEIIVIDDGSTDGGGKIADDIAKSDSRISIVHTKNRGVSVARNTGLREVKGEYVCFVDADDTLEPKFIDTMMKFVRQYDADYVINTTKCGDSVPPKTTPVEINAPKAENELLSQRIAVGCWNKFYKTELARKIQFEENLFYGEGLYFIINVAHNANRIILCHEALYNYRKVNPDSATTKFSIDKMINGEKSLQKIHKIIVNDGEVVNNMWSAHYSLFSVNALLGMLDARTFTATERRLWTARLRNNLVRAMKSDESSHNKLRILIAGISPRLLHGMLTLRRKAK